MSTTESPDGFEQFVAQRSAVLFRAAWLLTGDTGRAEDLLQTALAKAWRHWRTVRAADNPEAYVRRILVTTYATWWRRRWRGEMPSETVPEPPRHAAGADPADDMATRDTVRRALARLSRQQRAVVVLRYVEDLSIAETADVLGCSPGTVKVQAARGLAALRADAHLHHFVVEDVAR